MIFGEATPSDEPRQHNAIDIIRVGWLYALHARSAVARRRTWQAEMMLADLRNQIIALACIRFGLNPEHGRDAHQLPQEFSRARLDTRATHLDDVGLRRSLRITVDLYLTEIGLHDPRLSASLAPAVRALILP